MNDEVFVLRVRFDGKEYVDVCHTGKAAKDLFYRMMKSRMKENPSFSEE